VLHPRQRIARGNQPIAAGNRGFFLFLGISLQSTGRTGRVSALADFIDYAQKRGGAWFATRLEIANWWNDHHHEFEV